MKLQQLVAKYGWDEKVEERLERVLHDTRVVFQNGSVLVYLIEDGYESVTIRVGLEGAVYFEESDIELERFRFAPMLMTQTQVAKHLGLGGREVVTMKRMAKGYDFFYHSNNFRNHVVTLGGVYNRKKLYKVYRIRVNKKGLRLLPALPYREEREKVLNTPDQV